MFAVGWVWGPGSPGVGSAIALLLWCAVAAGALHRVGERMVVDLVFNLTPMDLSAVFNAEVNRAVAVAIGPEFDHFDWYLQESAQPNAFAVGGHTIFVATGVAELHQAGVLLDEHVVAVVLHEYGHHRGGFTRAGAMMVALMGGWFVTKAVFNRLMKQLVQAKASDQLLALGIVALSVGFTVLVLVRDHPWVLVAMALVVAVVVVVLPAVAAKGRRAEELRADDVVVELGYGEDLAEFLLWWSQFEDEVSMSPWRRLMDDHPPTAVRAQRLLDLGVTDH